MAHSLPWDSQAESISAAAKAAGFAEAHPSTKLSLNFHPHEDLKKHPHEDLRKSAFLRPSKCGHVRISTRDMII